VNPGITEIDNCHNRLPGINHFPFAAARTETVPLTGQVFSYSQDELGLHALGFRVRQLSSCRFDCTSARHSPDGYVRTGRVQIQLPPTLPALERLHVRLGHLEVLPPEPGLIGSNSLFRQFDHPAAVTLNSLQRCFGLGQLCASGLDAGLRVGYIARRGACGRLLICASFRTFDRMLKSWHWPRGSCACNSDGSRSAIKSPCFTCVLHPPGFYNSALNLRAHHHLVGIHRTDQHQVFRSRRGEQVVGHEIERPGADRYGGFQPSGVSRKFRQNCKTSWL